MRIDDWAVGVVSPRTMRQRMAERAKAEMIETATRSATGRRGYDAARHSRLTQGWRAGPGSADAEISPDLATLRNRSRDLARNNPYVASAVRQLVANLVGDGMEARAVHPDPHIQKLAQGIYLGWAKSKVDGWNDFYGVQGIAVRAMIESGDVLQLWSAANGVPDAVLTLIEGDQLESPQAGLLNRGPRIIDGVEYGGTAGARAAYHILEEHPGDRLRGFVKKSRRIDAQHVDHLFEQTRPGQSRGVPWLCPSIRKLRELEDLANAILTKKKLQACIGIIRTLSADEADEVDTGTEVAEGDEHPVGSGSPALDRMTPGMVVEGLPGEEFTTIAPTADGDSDVFFRQELRSVAASLGIPDYLMTGDVSQANYSSLRAALVAFYKLLDHWQQNIIIPRLLDPAFARIMRREALLRREPRLAEVTAVWTPPPREWVDPIKDVAARIMEQRAGYKNMPEALAERGIEWREHFEEAAMVNSEIDRLGLVFDTDPRKINGTGALQPPAGFVLPKLPTGSDERLDQNVIGFFGRMLDAVAAGDSATINAGFIEAATGIRSGAPNGQVKAAIIAALTGADEPENRPQG
jgi:lambda family phage portal protein